MDDREFFDLLHTGWEYTTGAADHYWMVEQDSEAPMIHRIYAVNQDDKRKYVAGGLNEHDAAFIAGVHGCFGELIRRLKSALDEADNLDIERDALVHEIYGLEQEIAELRKRV